MILQIRPLIPSKCMSCSPPPSQEYNSSNSNSQIIDFPHQSFAYLILQWRSEATCLMERYSLCHPHTLSRFTSLCFVGRLQTSKCDCFLIQPEITVENLRCAFWFAYQHISIAMQMKVSIKFQDNLLYFYGTGMSLNEHVVRYMIKIRKKDLLQKLCG